MGLSLREQEIVFTWRGRTVSGIFISYRRADTQPDARQLARRLSERFGKQHVFRDVEDIPKGYSFAHVIRETLARCNVVLVLIGGRWLDAANEEGRRLDDPEDTFAMQSRKRPPAPPLTGSQDAMYELNGPALVYEIELLPGTYYLYLRASAATTDQDAVFVSWQAEDKAFPTRLTGEKGLKFKPPELNWQPGQGGYLEQAPIEVVVDSAGRHTFFVRMRKTGLALKSILLSPNTCDFSAYPCDMERACGMAP